MTDKLILANMLFYGYHGALPEEIVLGQRFSVSLEIECDTRPAAESDDLSHAFNYAVICQAVKDIVEGPPCKLLETLAERIAAVVLDLEAISVSVTVKKLHPPVAIQMDYAAVQIERSKAPKPVASHDVGTCLGTSENKNNRPFCYPSCERAYLSLGSSLGDRAEVLSLAVEALTATPGITVLQVAGVLETDPVGYLEQGKFLNTAVAIDTILSPYELLSAVQHIEDAAGRVRHIRFGPRTLDIDILLYGSAVVNETGLTIPHPRMHEREFVLVPLTEIAPDAVVPPDNLTVQELCARLLGKEV